MTRAQKQCVMSLEGQSAVSRFPYRPLALDPFNSMLPTASPTQYFIPNSTLFPTLGTGVSLPHWP